MSSSLEAATPKKKSISAEFTYLAKVKWWKLWRTRTLFTWIMNRVAFAHSCDPSANVLFTIFIHVHCSTLNLRRWMPSSSYCQFSLDLVGDDARRVSICMTRLPSSKVIHKLIFDSKLVRTDICRFINSYFISFIMARPLKMFRHVPHNLSIISIAVFYALCMINIKWWHCCWCPEPRCR